MTTDVSQNEYAVGGGKTVVGVQLMQLDSNAVPQPISASNPLSSLGYYKNAIVLTANTPASAGSALLVSCTLAGNVEVQMAGSGTMTFAVIVGATVLPLSVTEILSASTTATATYYNLS